MLRRSVLEPRTRFLLPSVLSKLTLALDRSRVLVLFSPGDLFCVSLEPVLSEVSRLSRRELRAEPSLPDSLPLNLLVRF